MQEVLPERSRKIVKWSLYVTLGSILFVVVLSLLDNIFTTERIVITVRHNDAPAHCNSRGQGRFGPKRDRSSAPELGIFGYCGYVETDRGLYMLPEAWDRLPVLYDLRSELQERLQPGCRFEVETVGFGKAVIDGRKRVPLVKTITRIREDFGCGHAFERNGPFLE
ncbi:MAG: hypothetical protein HRU32_00265 [Rhodobacteraceae bacterium]|nr:hypothetical protein [Paracoccaceae bacterium]